MEQIKNKKNKFWNIVTYVCGTILIVICSIVILFNITHRYHYVEGASMQPTLNYESEDAVFSSKIKSYSRGDIIIVEKEDTDVDGNKVYVIKRLIAIAGDKVCIKLINDEYRIILIKNGTEEEIILEEDYLLDYSGNKNLYEHFYNMTMNYYGVEKDEFLTIPENQVFYLGDNRNISNDCSIYGAKDKSLVVGKVDYIIYGKTNIVGQILKQFFGW